MKVAVIQKEISPHYSSLVQKALEEKDSIIVLPEYFYFDPNWNDKTNAVFAAPAALQNLQNLSKKNNSLIIAGSVVEPLPDDKKKWQSLPLKEKEQIPIYNRSHVFYQGKHQGVHTKMRLFQNENKFLFSGNKLDIIETPIGYLAILICADVLEPGIFDKIKNLYDKKQTPSGNQKPFLGTFCPTTSPRKQENEQTRKQRDQDIYGYGAKITQAPIFKSCSIGSIRGNPIQGRSLIALPDGVIVNAKDIDTEEVLYHDLNIP